jgi:hypothetical protein
MSSCHETLNVNVPGDAQSPSVAESVLHLEPNRKHRDASTVDASTTNHDASVH